MSDPRLVTAYSVCRGIARREARNFYYSFLALPAAKRNALSAVYAFMRHADDISDNESLSKQQRRETLGKWLDEWHRTAAGEPSSDPVFVALADAQQRFNIPSELLDQLVQGTAMDLQPSPEEVEQQRAQYEGGGTAVLASRLRTMESFDDLYKYCYLVASVVGLVCIRIYGYRDVRAESLAEQCGIAFQLTNILRDVKEDAAAGRLYLPEEDLQRFGLQVEDFLPETISASRSRLAPLMDFEAKRAFAYYTAGEELIGLVDEDSRSALWVMVTIYKRLLQRISESNYDVWSKRVSLSAPEKIGILARGMFRSALHAW